MATARNFTCDTKVQGIDMINLDELEDQNIYEQLFTDDATEFFLPYESGIAYDPEDKVLEQAFIGNVKAFEGYQSESAASADIDTKPSPLVIASHCGHLALVQYLCQKGVSVDEVSLRGITPLFAAAAEGQIHVMTWLLQNKADANAQEESGYHPLIISALQGRGDMVKLLLHYGANVDLADQLGRTALMAASQKGNIVIVEILLKKGALVGLQSKSGSTAAVYAAMSDQFEVLRMLHTFDPDVLQSYGSQSITLLAHICRHGNLDLVKAMHDLDHTILDQVDEEGRTALMAATDGGHVELVKYLVENGVSVNKVTATGLQALSLAIIEEMSDIIEILVPKLVDVDVTDSYGNTLMLLASEIGDLWTVKVLVESSADVNHQNHLGFTPLMVASKQGHINIINYLLGKDIDIERTTQNDLTAVDIAYLHNKFDVVTILKSVFNTTISPHLQLFVAAHGDVAVMEQLWKDHMQAVISDKTVEKYGVTCLMVASYRGCVDIVQFLLNCQVSAKATNRHGFTALEYALTANQIPIVDILSGHGLHLELNSEGQSFIHSCVMSGCHDMVSEILYLGTDINCKTADGLTSLMIASQRGMLEMVKLFISKGAALSEKSKEGFTAREYAFMNDNHGIARFLEEAEMLHKARKETDNPVQSQFERMLLDFQLRQQLNIGMPSILPSFSGNVSPFLQACMADDQQTAEKLCKEGCNVYVRDMEGDNALTVVCERGSTRLAEWLIVECHLSPNSANYDNFTALMAASRGGHLGCANVLLDHHALINAKDLKTSKAALHIAVANNHTEIVEVLLNRGAMIDIEDVEGITPISLACLRGNLESVQILVHRNADIHHRDRVGRTPVMSAARNGHLPILELLVEQYNAHMELITYHGKTAMSYAAQSGHHEVVSWIESQINSRRKTKIVATPNEEDELSPTPSTSNVPTLMESASPGPPEDLEFCHVQDQMDCPLCLEGLVDNVTGWTYNEILYTCVRSGNILRLITLLGQGFDVNYQNEDGLTLLMVAASLGEVEMVAILLERDADVNIMNHQGQDAMTLALDAQHFGVAELLADKLHRSHDNLVIIQGWSSEENNFNRGGRFPAESQPTDTDSVKLHQQINEKWKQMIDECYKVISMVICRDRPADIYHVYRSWEKSEFYIHTRPDQLDQVKAYINDKILHLLPCSKFLCMKYVLMPDKAHCKMLSMKNPVEHFYRQMTLENGRMNAAAHSDLVNEGQGEGSRSEVHMHSDKELLDLDVVIQGCSSPGRIVMTSIVSQHRSASSSASAAKPVFYTDTFAVIMGDNFTGSLSRLNGNLVHLADTNQAIGFVLGQVHNICLPEEENTDNIALLCFKIN